MGAQMSLYWLWGQSHHVPFATAFAQVYRPCMGAPSSKIDPPKEPPTATCACSFMAAAMQDGQWVQCCDAWAMQAVKL